jgi:hypothetical protein
VRIRPPAPPVNPDWDADFAYGKQGELLWRGYAEGIANGNVEVKHDRRVTTTGNLYIEVECYYANGWRGTGPADRKAQAWAFILGDSGITLFIPTAALLELIAGKPVIEMMRGSHPTHGVLLPIPHVLAWIRGTYHSLWNQDL